MRSFQFIVPPDLQGHTLKDCLVRLVTELGERTAPVALEVGCVFVGRKREKHAGRRIDSGQRVSVNLGAPFDAYVLALSAGTPLPHEATALQPRVLYEDRHLVVVDKPSGVHTVPTPEGDLGTLLWQLERREPAGPLFVVHRLDMLTSGVLVFARTATANQKLAALFKRHHLLRRYDAFVCGRWTETTTIRNPVGGKPAVTHVRPVSVHGTVTRLECQLETGRTHQIRKHLTSRGHPIAGDPEYGRSATAPRLALHARQLSFRHPLTQRHLNFEAELPDDLESWLRSLSSGEEPSPVS
jgi:23S rRNA pseudouridine1911/1915/1917 synthase